MFMKRTKNKYGKNQRDWGETKTRGTAESNRRTRKKITRINTNMHKFTDINVV